MLDKYKKTEKPTTYSENILDRINERARLAEADRISTNGAMRNLNADYDRVIDGKDEEFGVIAASDDSRFFERESAAAARRVAPFDVNRVFPHPAASETKTGPLHRAEKPVPMRGLLGAVSAIKIIRK